MIDGGKPMLQIGDIIDGRYEILKEIGRGGMSVIYLAMDNRLNKSLAVKDIRKRDESNSEILIHSLVVEANMLKRLDHGSLPRIYDIIEDEGDIYVVMDYIEGESLQEKIERDRIIPAEIVIDWAMQLCDVLDYLHTRKPNPIIYRDMKPDNVMLTPDNKIKLIDFGIAREYKAENLTDTTNLGTKAYASPEQVSGVQTDERTDIYSLGVTLYHLVTGKSLNEPPFEIRPIRTWDPSLPEGLEYIIEKCTQAEPDQRYQNCKELAYDLENIDKLTRSYKKVLYKKVSVFAIFVMMFLTFSMTAVFGYNGMKKEHFQDYMKIVNEASIALINGEETNAIELLEEAILVDHKRPEAYINLLDIYISIDETDTGIAKIRSYMNDKYGNIHRNNELLFKMGMTYFDVNRDYQSALQYFAKTDVEEIEAVQYYISLATTMGSLNLDYDQFLEELIDFEKYNDTLRNDVKKIENYNALANIYLSYRGQIEDANSMTIRVIEKAQKILEILDDKQLNVLYLDKFENKLAQSYYSRAIIEPEEQKKQLDFNRAIEHYTNLLDYDTFTSEEILETIGVIYREMGAYQKAAQQFKSIIEQYPSYIAAYVQLGNLLLDQEQSKPEDERNFTAVKKVYERASQVEGMNDNDGYKKLKNRLMNFDIQ